MEYVVYKVRWGLLGILVLGIFTRSYALIPFSVINDVVSSYFRISPYETDLLSMIDTLIAVFGCVIIGVTGTLFGIRILMLLLILFMFINATACAIGFTSRELFWLVMLGRVISGFGSAITVILPALLAAEYFPPHEVATSFALSVAAYSLGTIPSILIFTQYAPKYEIDISGNVTEAVKNDLSAKRVANVFIPNMSVLAALMVVCAIFAVIYAKDRPPTPPSASQAQQLTEALTARTTKIGNLQNAIYLFSNKPFVYLTLSNSLCNSSLMSSMYLSPSLIKDTFPDLDNKMISRVSGVVAIAGFFGGAIIGKLLDRFGSYKAFSLSGCVVMIVSGTGLYVAHMLRSFYSLLFLYSVLMFFRQASFTSYVEFMLETTYPLDKTLIMSFHLAIHNLGAFGMSTIERIVLDNFGAQASNLVIIVTNLVSLILLSLVEPNYKRSEVNKGLNPHRVDENDEGKPLMGR